MKQKKWKQRMAALSIAAALCMSGVNVSAASSDGNSPFSFPTGDSATRVPPDKLRWLSAADANAINDAMSNYVASDTTLVQNHASSFYYYNQLNSTAKEIYDIMLMIAQDPATDGNYGVMMTDMNPDSDEYYYEMLCAYFAMTYDHPELFWLYNASETSIQYSSEVMSMNGIYLVYYGLTEPYYNYQTQMTAFNRAAEEFLKDIDRTASEYEIAKQIHDKLIEQVTYDNYVLENMNAQGQNLAHTAYGALVSNSQGLSNYAVCDGYSLAYEYLLQQCGIEAVVVAGDAGSNEWDTGGHAWNMVKLDNVWYEVDSTWDDAGTMDASLTYDIDGYEYYYEALHDTAYREKLQHYLFLISTERIRNYVSTSEYDYVTKDQRYVLNLAGDSVHIRFSNNGLPEPRNADPSVISLAPVASANYVW